MKNKKYIIALGCFVLLLLAGGVFWYQRSNDNPPPTSRPVNTVDYNAPTGAEQQAGDQQKTAYDNEGAPSDNNNSKVAVLISDAAQYESTVEVRAYIPNLLDNPGTCTADFYKGTQLVASRSQTAFRDASTTQCGALDVPRSEFPTDGPYEVVVNYKSQAQTGSSERKTVRVY